MANFLGNMNWEKMADVFGHAAAMYKPGGVAEWQRGKDARANNELLRRIQEQQLSQAKTIEDERASRMDSLSRIMGPVPTSPSPASFGYDFMTDTTEGFDAALAGDVAAHQRQTDLANYDPDAFIAQRYREMDPTYGVIGSQVQGFSRFNPDGTLEQVTEPSMTKYQTEMLELSRAPQVQGQPIQLEDGTWAQQMRASDGTITLEALPGTPAAAANRIQQQTMRDRPVHTDRVNRLSGRSLRQTIDGRFIDEDDGVVNIGNVVSGADFDKDRANAQVLYAAVLKGENLKKRIHANPDVFNKAKQFASRYGEKSWGQIFPGMIKSALFEPSDLALISEVNAQAAETIKEFYGAVLSLGEEARANTFVVQEGEDINSQLAKIDAGISMAKAKFPGMIKGAVEVAHDSVYGTDQGGMDLPEYQTPEEAETAFNTGVITYEMFHVILKQLEEDENNGG
jgi:hypothetical protein